MAGKPRGGVLERNWKKGRGYALRFSAYGRREYLTLGFEDDGWTRKAAEEELEKVLAEVRLGIWVRPEKQKRRSGGEPEEEGATPVFASFARRLVDSREGQVSESQQRYERWGLAHLLGYFGDWPLADIDVQAVDAYRHRKVQEADARRRAIERRKPLRDERGRVLRPLAASSINKTIDLLQWVLSVALEYKHVTENAAAGKRRRLVEQKAPPVHLDTVEQIEALLDAAAELDADLTHHLTERKAILATLVLAGPRAHELCNLLWRDIDLANGRLHIGRSKTAAGRREIKMLPVLRDVLAAHKARAYRSGPEDLVFPTGTGGRRNKDNLRGRVLGAAVERADEVLAARGRVPLPKGLTPHKLRHTFASVLIACGEDPASVMRQLGHTDPAFTLRTYTHLMSREPGERGRLKALVNGERAVAVGLAEGPPRLLDCAAYELPILRALRERGGAARRKEIQIAVSEELAGSLTDLDRHVLPCGAPRWQARLAKAGSKLKKAGCLKTDSPRGRWELAAAGIERLRRAEASRPGGAERPSTSGIESGAIAA